MLEGIYDSFDYGPRSYLADVHDRLLAIRQAGFDLVLNYATGGMDQATALRYANDCAAHNLRVIWNPWTGMDYWQDRWIDAVKGHPGTWGYYVGDEAAPDSAEASQVRALGKRLKETGKPTLYVSRPGRKALQPFLDVATHVGPDCYPIGCPPWWPKPDPQRIGDVAAWARAMVDEAGGAKKLAFVCQAFAWGALLGERHEGDPIIWPTRDQMAAMRRAVIRRGHPDLLLWFAAHVISEWYPVPEQPHDQANYWAGLAAVIL